MFNKNKKELKEANTKYEEMEVAEEFGDGWFVAGVVTGVATAGAIIVLT
ncbi:MAG: hypothetical protein ACLRTZ_15315 [Agathobacter sp.]